MNKAKKKGKASRFCRFATRGKKKILRRKNSEEEKNENSKTLFHRWAVVTFVYKSRAIMASARFGEMLLDHSLTGRVNHREGWDRALCIALSLRHRLLISCASFVTPAPCNSPRQLSRKVPPTI